jgi:methyl-CpG-binding domain protein 4
MLNRTRGDVVKPVAKTFFEKWPDPESIVQEKEAKIVEHLKPLGLANIRAKNLKKMAEVWVRHPPKSFHEISNLPGVGPYAVDAYRIFVNGEKNLRPDDEILRAYLSTRPIARAFHHKLQ